MRSRTRVASENISQSQNVFSSDCFPDIESFSGSRRSQIKVALEKGRRLCDCHPGNIYGGSAQCTSAAEPSVLAQVLVYGNITKKFCIYKYSLQSLIKI